MKPKDTNMEKLTRTAYNSDGTSYQEVAIIISQGYGSGFSTWSSGGNMEREKSLAEPVAFNCPNAFYENLSDINGKSFEDNKAIIDFKDLIIEWIPEGSAYSIDEYDGMETLVTINSLTEIA